MNHLTYIHNTDYNKHQEERWMENFCKPLSDMMNTYVIPIYGGNLKFDIQLGFWTSDEYGSYKIPIYTEEKELCYIIGDVILGKWKLYKSE